MQLGYHDYIILLKAEVERKRRTNSLPLLLVQPSPGSIRSECANVCRERYEKKDEPALRAFFGPAENEKQLLKFIEGYPVDKFRPLVKYLKGGTGNTEEKNIELLAWLIDFRHRPYGFKKNVLLSAEEQAILDKGIVEPERNRVEEHLLDDRLRGDERPVSEDESIKDPTPTDLDRDLEPIAGNDLYGTINHFAGGHGKLPDIPTNSSIQKKSRFLRGVSILILLFLIVCTIEFLRTWIDRRGDRTVDDITNNNCMYWAGDHYEQIPCDQIDQAQTKLHLDVDKIRNFRKILRSDTITEYSIGKIYYLKIYDSIEYYTSKGSHPIENNRSLKVLSQYMYDKYLK